MYSTGTVSGLRDKSQSVKNWGVRVLFRIRLIAATTPRFLSRERDGSNDHTLPPLTRLNDSVMNCPWVDTHG